MTDLDIDKNRRTRKWSRREQVSRVLWAAAHPFFRLSPRPLWGWRRWMLSRFRATIGAQVHVYPNVRITMPWNLTIGDHAAVGDRAILYALGPIEIKARATISQGAHLCAGTHDISLPDRPLVKSPITVGEDVWVAADAFVGPGVTLGKGSILGARAVVVRDVPPHAVMAGNPAKLKRYLKTEDQR